MHPSLELDAGQMAENARAWRDFCAPAALWAVVKGDAYGWGLHRVVPVLEDVAQAFCVSDMDELRGLRKHSGKFAIVLDSLDAQGVREASRLNARPSVHDAAGVIEAAASGTVRIGIRPAAAWSGLTGEQLAALVPALRGAGVPVELWTHLTDPDAQAEQLLALESAREVLDAAGVAGEGCDAASTFPLAAGCRTGSAVRIGIGLFGATGGPAVPGVRCALRVRAPVVRAAVSGAGTRLGYGGTMLSVSEKIVTARCGYADGLPKSLEGSNGILSIGMQYCTARASRADEAQAWVSLLDKTVSLDQIARESGRLAHEIVTALGNSAF